MVRSKSHKEIDDAYPLLTARGIELIKKHTTPRIYQGMGCYVAYKDELQGDWKIGYGSQKLGKRYVRPLDRITQLQIDTQFAEDLKEFSQQVAAYVHVPLNYNRKAAVLSFAHSLGIPSFKECRLLNLINNLGTKSEIIREWSPYINRIWRSNGEQLINRRRAELNLYFTGDEQIATLVKHKCGANICLLNIAETFTGAPSQLKAIEYLEKKLANWDPTGAVLDQFFRQWTERPNGLGSLPLR